MNLRIGFYIFCFATLLSVLNSCLSNDETEYIPSSDAQITAFSLKHDSIPSLDSVAFTIDQFKGLIYNHDSMRYGTEIPEKVIVSFTTNALGILNITNIAENDSSVVSNGDSLDVSKPVRLRVYAYNGDVKYYQVNLNVHQIDPDSMRYWPIAENLPFLTADVSKTISLNQTFYTYVRTSSGTKLFSSTDGTAWKETPIDGFPANAVVAEIRQTNIGLVAYTTDGKLYRSSDAQTWESVSTEFPIKAVFGHIEKTPTQTAGIALLVEKEGKKVFAFMSDFVSWTYGEDVPQQFPIEEFSSVKMKIMSADRITIIGGVDASGKVLNASWSTTNGLYWAKITDDNKGLFPLMQGINAFTYDDKIYLLNGRLKEDNTYNRAIYRSLDGGTTWQIAPEKTFFPEEYTGRRNASVVVDKDNYIYVVGGRQEQPLTDVWVGVLNKLSFK